MNAGDVMGQIFVRPKPERAPYSERAIRQNETHAPKYVSSATGFPGMGPRVLLVHSDDRYFEVLATYLRAKNFTVIELDDPRAALLYVTNEAWVDVVLIDADLPGASGIGLLTRFQNLGMMFPAALAAACDEKLEERALEYGAADFLDKSRTPAIGAKRVCLLLGERPMSSTLARPQSSTVSIGSLDLKLQSHRALWRKSLVPLTVTEFRIVRLLASRAGEEVSYRDIYDVVHGAGFLAGDGRNGYRSNVRSLIRKIRKRFGAIDPDFSQIENYPGFGYRWRDGDATPLPRAKSQVKSGSAPAVAGYLPPSPSPHTQPRTVLTPTG
jgi:two-component system response regulator ChvI